nr:immunoglobulin heavy chain junction region [Macaca mulatta]
CARAPPMNVIIFNYW